MEALQFIYKIQEVDFLPSGNDNVMVNATQMAKIFGKKVEAFIRNESTQNFINESLKSENSRFLGIENESDLIDSRQKSGTWMHRVLALKFAAWLDPAFELWVYVTIDKIILGHYRNLLDASLEKLRLENELERKKEDLAVKSPEFVEFLLLQRKVNALDTTKYRNIDC